MKTYINAPSNVEIKKLMTEALQDDGNPLQDFWETFRDNLCDAVTSAGLQMGCGGAEQSSFVGSLCTMINGLLSTVGCEPIPNEPEVECIIDSDCNPGNQCIDNECEPILGYCDEESDCLDWQNCEDGFCLDDSEHCHFNPCEPFENCDDPSGDCELLENRCNTNGDCTWDAEEPVCDVAEHQCVECVGSEDCGIGFECAENICSECVPDAESCDTDEDCCGYPISTCVGDICGVW